MAYTVRKLPHRPWPVTVTLQRGADDGTVAQESFTFVGHWKVCSEKERKALLTEMIEVFEAKERAAQVVPEAALQEIAAAVDARSVALQRADEALGERARTLEANAWYFARRLVGWKLVLDEAGAPIPFSVEMLTELITGEDGFAFSSGLIEADQALRLGTAPEKNSATSPAPGPAGEVASPTPST